MNGNKMDGDTPPQAFDLSPAPVSSGCEELLLVDDHDRVIGYGTKQAIHQGQGRLHRAFSVFLFDEQGRVLIHQRSAEKPLWPGFWTNSCCSHPRRGETLPDSVHRRLREELGVVSRRVTEVYAFQYHAEFGSAGSEHELCHVFLAGYQGNGRIDAHGGEIADWRWCDLDEVDAMMAADRRDLTPWFRMEWQALTARYRPSLESFLATSEASLSPA